MRVPIKAYKLLFAPAEPAVPDALYFVQPTPDDPVEFYTTNSDGYLQPTGNAELIQLMLIALLLDSPQLGGVPTVPTAAVGTNTTQAASTAYVIAVRDAILNAAPGVLDTLQELAAALGNDANFSATMTAALAAKAAKSAIIPATMLLSSTAVDLNEGTAAKQALYTVPASRRAIVTRIDIDGLSGVPTIAAITMGWNAPATNTLDPFLLSDLIASISNFATLLQQPTSWLVGTAGQVLGLAVSTPEGSALTARINTFGYLTDLSGVPVSSL